VSEMGRHQPGRCIMTAMGTSSSIGISQIVAWPEIGIKVIEDRDAVMVLLAQD
jgi:hypothetical protein